ncbi:hypothetical protein PVC01_000011200 [Plasmodium vivax]|uniref:VIR protein n=2 Tax=Plasmodium vivax TaxID=5855 RepID=A0A1G4E290_PLAVI|nr:hypothetical protein PVC01_000011200 [Plasmodium vivax]
MSDEPDYDIFEGLDDYQITEHQVNKDYENVPSATFCKNIDKYSKLKPHLINICKKLATFFKHSYTNYDQNRDKPLNHKYPEFLNYWLRYQGKSQNIPNPDMSILYVYIENNFHKFNAEQKLKNKIHFITEEDF